ncbi:MAG: hypothetical protein BroJett013_06460 [Alphaproteobacteria bacterium]|nr:MAG: hypothetical protein BroJett013_06460 [Alphaproteobacteria bacterium]
MSPPLPPRDLDRRRPLSLTLPVGAQLSRFYPKGRSAIHFDRNAPGRFNAPDAAFGVLYAAQSAAGAFAETFLRGAGRRLIPPDLIAAKGFVTLSAAAPLRLVQLFGPGLTRVGATAEVAHGGLPYDCPQQWSGAIHALKENFDGIAYYARHDDNEICCALFDRGAGKISERNRETNLERDWFYALLERYDVGLTPD